MATNKATDVVHQLKPAAHNQDEHHELRPAADFDHPNRDLEKLSSGEVTNDFSRVATEDQEYFVTAKTWLVVWVRFTFLHPLCALS